MRRFAVLMFVVALITAACGGSDGGDTGETTVAPSTTAATCGGIFCRLAMVE